ncbi:MAG: hypothetical protein WCJ49_03750, partial [Deltaproteobacteria bacterium]
MITGILWEFYLTVGKWIKFAGVLRRNLPNIYFGRNPTSVSAPAIIIFPYQPNIISCGITGIVTLKTIPASHENNIFAKLHQCVEVFSHNLPHQINDNNDKLLYELETIVKSLVGEENIAKLFTDANLLKEVEKTVSKFKTTLQQALAYREQTARQLSSAQQERLNHRILLLEDIAWQLEKDVLANIPLLAKLMHCQAGDKISHSALKQFIKINFILNSINRLEVRGRDSAGLQINFAVKDDASFQDVLTEIKAQNIYDEFVERQQTNELLDGAIHFHKQSGNICNVSFAYKTFSVVGALGRNVKKLRQAIAGDKILKLFTKLESINETAFSHTRWASVGSITEENCHPINNYTKDKQTPCQTSVVLNGDIDNYLSLRSQLEEEGYFISDDVSTDTKIIPILIDKHLKEGNSFAESFRLAVNTFEGSHAIAVISDVELGKVYLAVKGSGQTIYVGITNDGFIFSSEIYGIVEVARSFVKMDGELLSGNNANGNSSGQIFVLNQNDLAGISAISASFYDGTPITLHEQDVLQAEITTRDIDRAKYPHYFLKEIMESP